MFIVASFMVAKAWKHLFSSTAEWIKKMCIYFWRLFDQKDGFLINGISALIKEDPESSCPISCMWVGNLQPRRGLSQEQDHAGTLTLNLQPLELWKINFCCL